MTEQIHDDRAAAYVQARELLTAAGDVRNAYFVAASEGRTDGSDEIPEPYWALVTEAEILSRLASCDTPVGYLAGAHMVQRKNRAAELDGIRRRTLRDARERRERPAPEDTRGHRDLMPIPFTIGDHVTLADGEYAGRRGRIGETQFERGAVPTATIELDPPGQPLNPSEPIVVTGIRFDSIELVN